ncbi:MAG: hypothetical protein PVJ64_13580 [Gemmatimonadales bacterium]|jgi:hypothetical protein
MALMGLLAAIVTKAITRKTVAAQAVLKSDLRNMATAEEAYFSDHLTYAETIAGLGFQGSQNVDYPDYRCALYVGRSVEPYSPALEEGKINCMPRRARGCSGG